MLTIYYQDSETGKEVTHEEVVDPSTEYINEVCKNEGWTLVDILDTPEGEVIVVIAR